MKNINEVRRTVTTLANRINRKIQNLSSAFIRAWQMIKAQQLIISKVTGTTFQNRQKALARLARINPKNISVELVREHDNKYDTNAIGIHVSVNGGSLYQIGFIPREIAELIASIIDKGIQLKAAFRGVTGDTFDRFNYGALVEILI